MEFTRRPLAKQSATSTFAPKTDKDENTVNTNSEAFKVMKKALASDNTVCLTSLSREEIKRRFYS